MTNMRSWKSHRLTSHIGLGLNPQIERPLSRIVGAIDGWFLNNRQHPRLTFMSSSKNNIVPSIQRYPT
jgi:hypothetical protein